MRNSVHKKYIIAITVGLLIVAFLPYVGGKMYYANKREGTFRVEILKIEEEISGRGQQANKLEQLLTRDATGKDVILLQRILSQNETIYPEKKITGYYGDVTEVAVKKFQETYNLQKTGSVNESTKNKLNEVLSTHLCPEQITIYPDFLLKRMTKQTVPLPKNYVPPALEEVSGRVKTLGTMCLRTDVIPSLERMFQDAKEEGANLAISSGHRKYEMQEYLYKYWHKKHGDEAEDWIAEPGRSEHQLGTTIDITDASIGYAAIDKRFAKSDGGKWMKKNAHKYGFVMSYPKGKEDTAGYHYEPWHWRFIGTVAAKALQEQKKIFNTVSAYTQEKPFPKNDSKEGLTLSAGAILSMFVNTKGDEHILIQKNNKRRMPIASITKLMTALVASEMLQPDDHIIIKQSALDGKGVSGKFIVNETISLKDALHAILIESNNEIAIAITEVIGTELFIQKMNEHAHELNMPDTHFVNVTGLDPGIGSEKMNYATTSDIAKLLHHIFKNKKDIFAILKKQEHSIITSNTRRTIPIKTTNELLDDQEVPLEVLGGKTGTTPKAKSNLTTVANTPSQKGHVITVVLRSKESFADTKNLLHYLNDMFVW